MIYLLIFVPTLAVFGAFFFGLWVGLRWAADRLADISTQALQNIEVEVDKYRESVEWVMQQRKVARAMSKIGI